VSKRKPKRTKNTSCAQLQLQTTKATASALLLMTVKVNWCHGVLTGDKVSFDMRITCMMDLQLGLPGGSFLVVPCFVLGVPGL
jgi:hypothetical protein